MNYDLLAFADLHLSNNSPLGTIDRYGVNTFVYNLKRLFFDMVDLAKDKNLILVCCGDFLDSVKPEPFIIKIFHEMLLYVVKSNVDFIMLSGNHEYDGMESLINSYSLLRKLDIMSKIHFVAVAKVLRISGVDFYCVPYMGKSIEQQNSMVINFINQAKENNKYNKVLLLHYPIVNARFNSKSIRLNKGFNLKKILKVYGNPFDYILAGDFHDRQRIKGIDNFLYLGQPYQGNISAMGNKRGFTLVSLDNKKTKLVVSEQCPTFVEFNNVTKTSDLPNDFTNKIVRIWIEHGVAKDRLYEWCYARNAYKVQIRTKYNKNKQKMKNIGVSFDSDYRTIITKHAKKICPKKISLERFTECGLTIFDECKSIEK